MMIKNIIAGGVLFLVLTYGAYLLRSSMDGWMGSVLDVVLASGELFQFMVWGDSDNAPKISLYLTLLVNASLGLIVGAYFGLMARARRMEPRASCSARLILDRERAMSS